MLKSLDKTQTDDDPLSLAYILESNGIKDAVWVLRCFDYKEYGLFLADIAESVLDIFENKYPDNNKPRLAIEAVRLFVKGDINKKELRTAAAAAYAAAAYAADAYAAYAAADAYAADAADAAAYAAYAADAYADAARSNKWKFITELFIQYFVES